jgi:ribosomal protein S18 acetylase RimI-like enzyme
MSREASLQRARLDPQRADDLAQLQAFIAAQGTSTLDTPLVQLLLNELPRSAEHLIALKAGGELALVASLIDTVRSWADVAIFELLAWSGDSAALELALDLGESLTADGPRAAIELPIYASMEPARSLLETRGYRWAFSSYDMQTSGAAIPEVAPLGEGWRWVNVDVDDPSQLEGYHGIVEQAFAGVPGANVGSVETLKRLLASLADPARLLLATDGRPAGVARISSGKGEPGRGTVDTIARAPGFRGQRLGQQLLVEALRQLRARGATHYWLSVAAENTDALALYRRFGFEVTREEPSYHSPELPR